MRSIVGLILAGGRGSRMGEVDKGLVTLHQRPMVAHVAERLGPQVGRLVISANRHADTYATYGTVVTDDPVLGGWQGPLAGVLAGMAACTPDEPWLVTVPCDTPFIPHDLVARLLAGAQAADAPLAFATAAGQRYPACMLVRVSLAASLRDWLASGERKVGFWQRQVGGVAVAFDDAAEGFLNINTAAELAQAELARG